MWGIKEEIADPFDAWGDNGLGPWCLGWRSLNDTEGSPWTAALVLAWEGKTVAEGQHRATNRGCTQYNTPQGIELALYSALVDIDGGVSLVEAFEDVGTVVFLDANGQELRDIIEDLRKDLYARNQEIGKLKSKHWTETGDLEEKIEDRDALLAKCREFLEEGTFYQGARERLLAAFEEVS